jgi:hypothetical protein
MHEFPEFVSVNLNAGVLDHFVRLLAEREAVLNGKIQALSAELTESQRELVRLREERSLLLVESSQREIAHLAVVSHVNLTQQTIEAIFGAENSCQRLSIPLIDFPSLKGLSPGQGIQVFGFRSSQEFIVNKAIRSEMPLPDTLYCIGTGSLVLSETREFGFVGLYDGPNVFVPRDVLPAISFQLPRHAPEVQVHAIRSYNLKKKEFSWKAIQLRLTKEHNV